jgi:hypothetical protein
MKIRIAPDKLKTILIMAGILLALALPLMFVLEDFVRDAIILPLGYYVWYFGVILDALPQSCMVGVLLAFLISLAFKSLNRREKPVRKAVPNDRQLPGNVRVWTERINLVSQGTYSRERFQHQFGQVLMRWVSHEERLSLRETVRHIQNGELEVAPELEPYLRRAVSNGNVKRPKHRLWHWFKNLFVRKPTQQTMLRHVAEEIEPALRCLEHQLKLVQGDELDG